MNNKYCSYVYSLDWLPKQSNPLDLKHAAIFFIDPQNSFYSKNSPIASLIQPVLNKNNTIKNQQELLLCARRNNMKIFYAPHKYTQNDYKFWDKDELNAIDRVMFNNCMFLEDTEGCEWFPDLMPDENTIILNPHKGLSCFQSGDAAIQLRENKIDTLILAGMAANMCVESHARDAAENGFKVILVPDCTAAAGMEAQMAAETNYEFLGNEVVTVNEIIQRIDSIKY